MQHTLGMPICILLICGIYTLLNYSTCLRLYVIYRATYALDIIVCYAYMSLNCSRRLVSRAMCYMLLVVCSLSIICELRVEYDGLCTTLSQVTYTLPYVKCFWWYPFRRFSCTFPSHSFDSGNYRCCRWLCIHLMRLMLFVACWLLWKYTTTLAYN